ncbi:MAG: hypothetical protein C4541_03010 [Candidatus Auribacter fodinae]|jgi:hypothetical protein|uniref:Glycosyl hydrolase n=1 Tax=Candidatus Auribacter fodinae TaxID=2093366 RepID=A0A3A4R8I1_9BACT|nr:MAG: hypothetical protein C4541_03010 [Candidatus Auribacter fodinae]
MKESYLRACTAGITLALNLMCGNGLAQETSQPSGNFSSFNKNNDVNAACAAIAEKHTAVYKDLERWIDSRKIQNGYLPDLGVDVEGLWASYQETDNWWSKYLASHGRMFIYDTSLAHYCSIVDDMKSGKFVESRKATDIITQMLRKEELRGNIGLLHFSYNTEGDNFIDPRKISGANLWVFKALYAYMLASGDTRRFDDITDYVSTYLLPLQVVDETHPAYGLITAGYGHPDGLNQGGYNIYDDLNTLNRKHYHSVLEHTADFIDLLRLMIFVIDSHNVTANHPRLREELVMRHALVMQGVKRMRKDKHWPTVIDGDGSYNWSRAVDHYTWLAAAFIGLDDDIAWESIEVLRNEFTTTIDSIEIIKGQKASRVPLNASASGLIFFSKDFKDQYVSLSESERNKLEALIQPEATGGGIVFLYRYAQVTKDDTRRQKALEYLTELVDGLALIHKTYSTVYDGGGMPYATENTHDYFNSTPSMAATATFLLSLDTLRTGYPFFIGVPVPKGCENALEMKVDTSILHKTETRPANS